MLVGCVYRAKNIEIDFVLSDEFPAFHYAVERALVAAIHRAIARTADPAARLVAVPGGVHLRQVAVDPLRRAAGTDAQPQRQHDFPVAPPGCDRAGIPLMNFGVFNRMRGMGVRIGLRHEPNVTAKAGRVGSFRHGGQSGQDGA